MIGMARRGSAPCCAAPGYKRGTRATLEAPFPEMKIDGSFFTGNDGYYCSEEVWFHVEHE
ncbi:hypothetical protein CHELA20_51268 [Hyphomicrobiales bacterium]|nr:hypothetical protein CHELA41_23744 [Hyphomicrobiales bacterium]CAH1674866.1 hypothetical protein CHELA20_51268 [Hyphomicrobiales bacterium]